VLPDPSRKATRNTTVKKATTKAHTTSTLLVSEEVDETRVPGSNIVALPVVA